MSKLSDVQTCQLNTDKVTTRFPPEPAGSLPTGLAVHFVALALVLAAVVGCSAATDNKNADTGAKSNTTITVPTAAELVGNWTRTRHGGTTTFTEILSIGADNTWQLSRTRVDTPQGQASSTFYSQYKGTFTLIGDRFTKMTTQYRDSFDPLTEAELWTVTTPDQVEQKTMVVANGKLHESTVCKAQGTPSGIVGTWVYEGYNSEDITPYTKTVSVYSATSIDATIYHATKADYSDAVTQNRSFHYVVGPQGQFALTFTLDGKPLSGTVYYLLSSSYLITSSDPDFGGWTKQ